MEGGRELTKEECTDAGRILREERKSEGREEERLIGRTNTRKGERAIKHMREVGRKRANEGRRKRGRSQPGRENERANSE